MKKLIYIVIALAILVGVAYLYFNNWYNSGLEKRQSESTDKVSFTVASGEGSDSIGKNLKTAGLIDSELLFKLYLRRENLGGEIQAGTFAIPKNSTIPEIVTTLSKAVDLNTVRVTIIEGYRNSQVGPVVETAFKGKQGAVFSLTDFNTIVKTPDKYTFNTEVQNFLNTYKPAGKSLEGFLYPDTYEFKNTATTQSVVETMIKQFIKKTENVEKGTNFYKNLTLASIVERESFTNAERPTIASVFSNRLKIGMALQSDATVNYATGKSDPQPTLEDTKVNSPYNTYKYTGLPPTPICNPRIESIQAAVSPAKTDYYYFIHEQDGSGTVHFAKTSAEHYANVRKYLK